MARQDFFSFAVLKRNSILVERIALVQDFADARLVSG